LSAEQGLPSKIISHLVDDGTGNLWIGSQDGILRVAKNDLRLCANGEAKSIHCLSYGRAEGLTVDTCLGGFQPGARRTDDGRIWFPTVRGLAIVDPANVTTNSVPPPVDVEALCVDDVTTNVLSR